MCVFMYMCKYVYTNIEIGNFGTQEWLWKLKLGYGISSKIKRGKSTKVKS